MTFPEFLADIQHMTYADVVSSGSSRLHELMYQASELFEQYPLYDQMLVQAMLFGMLSAVIDGEPTFFEQENGVLTGHKERTLFFQAIVDVTFKGAMAERARPDAPDFVKGSES